ncbi:hypothetical protein ACLOJK_037198 [Asimina triloba]
MLHPLHQAGSHGCRRDLFPKQRQAATTGAGGGPAMMEQGDGQQTYPPSSMAASIDPRSRSGPKTHSNGDNRWKASGRPRTNSSSMDDSGTDGGEVATRSTTAAFPHGL